MKKYVVTDDGNILYYNLSKLNIVMDMFEIERLQYAYRTSMLLNEHIWELYTLNNIKTAIFHSHLIGIMSCSKILKMETFGLVLNSRN